MTIQKRLLFLVVLIPVSWWYSITDLLEIKSLLHLVNEFKEPAATLHQDDIASNMPFSTRPNPIRLFFLGSGEIALPTLAALLAHAGIEVVGCATQPDRPQGRKQLLEPTPLGAWCEKHHVAVHKPASVNTADFRRLITALDVDLIVVFSFGQILKDSLLELPKTGSVNVHASLLPKYRGAAPVNAAILNGDRQTGISIMKMVAELDAGPVYARHSIDLTGREYAPELEQRLAELAADRICPALDAIVDGLTPAKQDHAAASFSPKLAKAHGRVTWERSAVQLERMVRGYFPWPGAWFRVSTGKGEQQITITRSTVVESRGNAPPGAFIETDSQDWIVACGEQALRLDRVIPSGKKEMTGAEYLRGRPSLMGLQPAE